MKLFVVYTGGQYGSPNDYGLADEHGEVHFMGMDRHNRQTCEAVVRNRKLLPAMLVSGALGVCTPEVLARSLDEHIRYHREADEAFGKKRRE